MFRRQLLRQSRAISETLAATQRTPRSPFSSATTPRRAIPAVSSHPSLRLGRRWQSTEAEKKSETEEKPAAAAEEVKEDPVKQELEKVKKEVVDLKDKYLRSVADYRNLQERTKREVESARNFALQRFATDLIDSIDNFDRALGSVPESAVATATETESNKDLVNLFSGLKMTEEILMATLKKHGLEKYDPMEGGGRKFDPNTDEATFFTKVEGKQDGDVFFTQSKGYKLNGRVLRAAKVGVVKNS